MQIQFQLDFGEERLKFSLFHDLGVEDTGTPESAETIAEVRRFEKEYFGNRSDCAEGRLYPVEHVS